MPERPVWRGLLAEDAAEGRWHAVVIGRASLEALAVGGRGMRISNRDTRIAFWPMALAGSVTMAVAVSGPVLGAFLALLALVAATASERVFPRIVTFLLVASAASAPLSWLSPNLGIIGGLAALLWLALASCRMMVHGARVLPRRAPGLDVGSVVQWDPIPSTA